MMRSLAGLVVVLLAFSSAQSSEPARRNLSGADFKPGGLRLPLVVTERSGVDRKGRVVSSGVPFPPGFLKDAGKLRVVDSAGRSVPSQGSLMVKWHKPAYDDSVQWALVSFPADVAAGKTSTYYLLDDGGADRAKSPLKLSESKGAITVQTGPARFVVPRKGPALISEAYFGEEQVIGGKGLRCVVKSGAWPDRGLKSGDRLVGEVAEAVVEEQGPVRIVLLMSGTFKPGDRAGKFYDFTARLYFNAGSPAVRVIYSINNGRLRPELINKMREVCIWPIEDASLVAELALGAGARARTLAEGKEVAAGELDVYQDSSGGKHWKDLPAKPVDRWLSKYTGGKTVRGVTFRGYRVTSGGKEQAAGKAHLGVIDAAGAKAGLAAALRNFRVEYPSALSGSGKELRVGLFPGEFSEPFHLNSGQRASWDLRLVLHGRAKPDLKALHAEAETLLLFRPQPAWMVRAACSGAWPTGLALLKDPEPQRPLRLDKSKLDATDVGRDWHGWISGWNSGGYHWNQNCVFGSWALWGDGPGFDLAETRALWAADNCAIHYQVDLTVFWRGLTRGKWRENRTKFLLYPGYYNRDTWRLPDSGHLAMVMWMEYYLLTGDMRAREASEHLGVRARGFCWRYNHDDKNDGSGPLRRAIVWCKKRDADAEPDFMTFNRYIGWPLYVLGQYYRLTGRPELLAECRNVARSFRNTGRYVPTGFLCLHINGKGDKGVYGNQGPFVKNRDLSASQCYAHFQMGIMANGLAEYYLMSRDVEALDTMIGFADFMCHHAMLRDPKGKRVGWSYVFGDYWGPYTYEDACSGGGPPWKHTWMVSNFRVVQPLGSIYAFTGRKDYLDVLGDALATLRKPKFSVIAAHMAAAHPKVDGDPPKTVGDLTAEALGGGRARLTWTVPKGGPACYQVKYAKSKIVERVKGWPDRTPPLPTNQEEWEAKVKTFQKKQLAFWQAFNVEGEPAHGAAGTKQEMTVEKLPTGKLWFALKSWDRASNMSDISNVVKLDVK